MRRNHVEPMAERDYRSGVLLFGALLLAANLHAQHAQLAAVASDDADTVIATTFSVEALDGAIRQNSVSGSLLQAVTNLERRLLLPVNRYGSLDRVIDDFQTSQRLYQLIAPPDPDFVFYAYQDALRVFDPIGFPDRFVSALVPESFHDRAYVYRITVCEDPSTRERVIFNAIGKEIWRQKAPANYDPWTCLRAIQSWGLSQFATDATLLRGLYDPARIRCEYLLLPVDSVPYYALATAMDNAKQALAQTATPQTRSMAMAQNQYAPAPDAFVFTALPVFSNGYVNLEIHLPDTVTCHVDLFGVPDLLHVPPWTLFTTTPATSGTFRVQFACSWSNGFFRAGNADIDSDENGIPDDRELFMLSSVSGVVHYSGSQPTNTVWDMAVTNADSWATNYAVKITGTGPYHIPNIPLGTNYFVKAWMDSNTNGIRDASEACRIPTTPIVLINHVTNRHLVLTDPDTDSDKLLDWWEVQQFGSITNYTGLSDPDGDGLHNLMEYWYQTAPLVANTNTAAADAVRAVDSKIAGLNPTNALPLFVDYMSNGVNGVFIRNTNCWAASYDLTCCSAWNSSLMNKYAGTLISPRHVLFAAHFAPPTNTIMLFVDQQNNVVTQRLVAVKQHPSYDPDKHYPDLTVGLLDSDVPTNRITFAKVLPDDFVFYIGDGRYLPAIRLNQYEDAMVGDVTTVGVFSPIGGTNVQYDASFASPANPTRSAFYKPIVGGDSGNPTFLLFNGQVVLLTVWSTGPNSPGIGASVTALKNDINQMMSYLGGGYQLMTISFAGFTPLSP